MKIDRGSLEAVDTDALSSATPEEALLLLAPETQLALERLDDRARADFGETIRALGDVINNLKDDDVPLFRIAFCQVDFGRETGGVAGGYYARLDVGGHELDRTEESMDPEQCPHQFSSMLGQLIHDLLSAPPMQEDPEARRKLLHLWKESLLKAVSIAGRRVGIEDDAPLLSRAKG